MQTQNNIEIPSVNGRPMRAYVAELLACAFLGGVMGWILGGGLS